MRILRLLLIEPFRFHFFGSFAIVVLVSAVLFVRVQDRRGFADVRVAYTVDLASSHFR